MLVFAIVDRFLDIVGGLTILYLTIKACAWYWRRGRSPATAKPRAWK